MRNEPKTKNSKPGSSGCTPPNKDTECGQHVVLRLNTGDHRLTPEQSQAVESSFYKLHLPESTQSCRYRAVKGVFTDLVRLDQFCVFKLNTHKSECTLSAFLSYPDNQQFIASYGQYKLVKLAK